LSCSDVRYCSFKRFEHRIRAFIMERWVGKIAVVTGASSGIGAAISLKLANEGMIVFGLARRVEKVQELSKKVKHPKGVIHGVKFDVTDVDAVPALFADIKKRQGGVDVMVNNAGILRSEFRVCESPTKDFQDVINTNLLAMAVFSREAIMSMRDRKFAGHVFNINSVAGHKVLSDKVNLNIYYATKHGVTALNETLRLEMVTLGTKIKVTSISPGIVKTDIFDVGGLGESFGVAKMDQFPHITSEDIADSLAWNLSTPPSVLVSEMIIRNVMDAF